MRTINKRILKLFTITLTFLVFSFSNASAQTSQDFFHSIGKIYVVVAVVLILFIGLVAYLFYLDRKISRLEQKLRNESQTS